MKNQPCNRCISKLILFCCALILASVECVATQGIVRHAHPVDARIAKTRALSPQHPPRKKQRLRKPDVIYYPTPPDTVDEMLRMAKVRKGDVLYDLGSGDGRIPIAAARQYGIRAVGIEIDPKLVTEAEQNARQADVSRMVSFRNEDMFRVDVSDATIVT